MSAPALAYPTRAGAEATGREATAARLDLDAALAEQAAHRALVAVRQAGGWDLASVELVERWAMADCQHAILRRDAARVRAGVTLAAPTPLPHLRRAMESADTATLQALPRAWGRLSRQERNLAEILYRFKGRTVRHAVLLTEGLGVAPDNVHILRVNVHRLRAKLVGTGWAIESEYGAYRLAGPDA